MARLPRLVQMGHGARGLRTNCVAEAECFGPIRFMNVVFAQRAYAPMNMCMGMHMGCTVVRAVSRCQQSCQNLVWWPAATLIPDLFDTTYVLTSCVLACDDSAGWWVSMYSGVLIKKKYMVEWTRAKWVVYATGMCGSCQVLKVIKWMIIN
jgi:hypothetical protein